MQNIKNKLWVNIQEDLKDNLFNKDILKKIINRFYDTVINNINEDQHILFLFRVVLFNDDIKTITKLLKLNKLEKEGTIDYLWDAFNLTVDNYSNSPIKSIIISYGIRKGQITPTITTTKEIKSHHVYYNHKLPIAILPEDYGDVLSKVDNTMFISLKKNTNLVIKSESKDGRSYKNHIKYFKNGKLAYEWTDYLKEGNSLIREIGKTTFYWKDDEIIWTKKLKNTKPLSKKGLSSDLKEDFITMDLETYGVTTGNGVTLTPYLLSWYDGKRDKSHSYFIENGNIKNMIYSAMKDICIRKYKGYKIYFHNFSKFDAIFIIKYLVDIGECNPIIHKGKIISFNFSPNWKKDFGTITFLDSYLLLSSSLGKLSKSFNIDSPKDMFPILLNDISYKGDVPSIGYFNNISLGDYNNYKEKFNREQKYKIWNFKKEAIKYCELDCKSLYQILSKFNKLIFNKFSLNIQNFPTLPSLAFNIFRSSYYKEQVIHQLSGQIDKDIRSGYTGGSTDMFIPSLNILSQTDKKIYAYDVNSLYPSVMLNKPYPVGTPTYFEGDILKDSSTPFGFFYVNITAPDNLLHPILQLHHKTKDGVRTVSPLGKFSGWFFSEELFNAQKFGYKFEVLRGYLFEKGYIFKDYVNDIYNLRLNYPKTDPMNYTAKILLNSLYGRFGMDDSFNTLEIVGKIGLQEIEESNLTIENITPLSNENKKFIVSYSNARKQIKTKIDGGFETHNVNIAIASAVTAYARIHMSQFKNNPLLPNLYYTDTDSLYFDGPLPDYMVDPKRLGALKLEQLPERYSTFLTFALALPLAFPLLSF